MNSQTLGSSNKIKILQALKTKKPILDSSSPFSSEAMKSFIRITTGIIFSYAFIVTHVWAGMPKQTGPYSPVVNISLGSTERMPLARMSPCSIKHYSGKIPKITISKSSLSRTNSECANANQALCLSSAIFLSSEF